MGIDDGRLTIPEKREFLERLDELIRSDVINREDRRKIYSICLLACERELADMKED